MRKSLLVIPALLALTTAPGLTWQEGRRMPRAKAGATTALLAERLVLAGGTYWEAGQKHWTNQVDVYDIRQDEWRLGPALPFALSYGAFVRSEQGLEVLGGWDGKRLHRECWLLGPDLVKWVPCGALPEDRVYGRAEVLGSKLYVLGGSSDAENLSRATDTLLAAEGTNRTQWKYLAPIPGGPRALHASAVAAGRIFVFGGCRGGANGDVLNLGDAYSYEPETGAWKRLLDLPRPVRSLSATAVGGRFIYLFGGYTATTLEARTKPLEYGFSSAVYVYDIQTDHYKKTASLPIPISDIHFVLHDATFYGAGGEDRNYGRSARTLIGHFHP
jgi:N-acetylneuraminic acid mutarotase